MDQSGDGEDHDSVQILQLHSWADSPLSMADFRTASLSPSRHTLSLQSNKHEIMLVPLRSNDVAHNISTIPSAPPPQPPPTTKSTSTLSAPTSSGPSVSRSQGTSSGRGQLGPRHNRFIVGALSFCWGSSCEGYGADKQLHLFKEILIVVGEKGLFIHVFPEQTSKLENHCPPLRTNSSGSLTRGKNINIATSTGRWMNWGMANLDPSTPGAELQCPSDTVEQSHTFRDETRFQDSKDEDKGFTTFLMDAQVQKRPYGVELLFLESNCLPEGNILVTYSIPYHSAAFSCLAVFCEYYESRCDKDHAVSATDTDVLPQLASLQELENQALLGKYKFVKLFSSPSSDTLGMLLQKGEQDLDTCEEVEMEDSFRSRLFILICKVLHSGLKWFSVIEPGKLLTNIRASQWVAFAIAGNNLFGLYEKGNVYVWTLTDAKFVANIDVLQHCGLPSRNLLGTDALLYQTALSEQEFQKAVDVLDVKDHLQEPRKGKNSPEQSNKRSLLPSNKRFTQMVVSADCLFIAAMDTLGLVYLVSTDGSLLGSSLCEGSKAVSLPSSCLSSWAVGAIDIGSHLPMSLLRDQPQSNVSLKEEFGTATRTSHGSFEGNLSNCSSGFSSKSNLARFGVRHVRFRRNHCQPLRRIFLPMEYTSPDSTLCLNPFGITQVVQMKEETQYGRVILRMLHLPGEVCDDGSLEASSKPSFLQGPQLDYKQTGPLISFCLQGYLHFVSEQGLYVVLPPLSLRRCQWKGGSQGRWWFTGAKNECFPGDFMSMMGANKSRAMFRHWQIEVLDKALIYDGLDEAEHLAAENGWCQKLVRLRRLQLALNYAQLDEIEQGLDGLVHVGAAEAGVPRVLFYALELMSSHSSGDNELGQASRLLSLAARFVIKLIRRYGMWEWTTKHQKHWQSTSKEDDCTLVSSVDGENCSNSLCEMSRFLEIIRKMQNLLQLKRRRPQPGKKETGDEIVVYPSDGRQVVLGPGLAGLDNQIAEKVALSDEAVSTTNDDRYSEGADSMWMVRKGGGAWSRSLESSREMFYRWEKQNLDMAGIVREALRAGRLPLAVVQLHRLHSRDLVQQPLEPNAFKEIQGIGRAFVYELFFKGETVKAMAALSRLGEDIETVLRELGFGTLSRYLRAQVFKELARLKCLNSQDLQTLETISVLERAYPNSSFWDSYGAQQRLLPAPAGAGSEEALSDNLQLVCSLKGHHDFIITCGEVDGIVLGCWGGAENLKTVHNALGGASPRYWAGAAMWLSQWDRQTLDRVLLDHKLQMGEKVSWEACVQTQIASHNWAEVSSLLDSIPESVLQEGELRVRLDCSDTLDLYRAIVEEADVETSLDERGSHHAWAGLDIDAVDVVIPRVKILSVALGNVCTGWLWQMMEEKLAKSHVFLRRHWHGTRELVSLLARAGLLSEKSPKSYGRSTEGPFHSVSSKSLKTIKLHKDAVQAIHELFLRHCVRQSLPNLMGLYLDHHSLALDNMSAVVMQAVVGDCQWALWLLFSRIKGREYDASFANARTILAHNFSPGKLSSGLDVDEFILTVDDMAMVGGETMALCTLMYAPVALEKCLCTGSINRLDGPSWQCTLENLRPGLQRFPTLWRTLVTACFDPDTWYFTTSSPPRPATLTRNKGGLFGYLQWREQLFSSACGDTSLLQMLPRWYAKGVRRLLQIAVQGPVGRGQGFCQDGSEQPVHYAGMEVDALSWEAAVQKGIEEELYASSKFEDKGVGAEHHLRRGRAMAAFNSLLSLRLQNFNAQGSLIREHVGKFQRGQMHISSELQAVLSPLTTHEEKYLSSVLPLAIMNYENSVVVAACASFLELCGLPATMLRVDIAALCRISAFYKVSGQSELETGAAVASPETQVDWSNFYGTDVAGSLARALADEYMETGVVVLTKRKIDASGKRIPNERPSRTLMAVLQELEKASLMEGPRMSASAGSWLMNGLGDGSQLRAQQRESSERWSLVTTFCNVHQLPISTVYLTTLARDNDWVGFLAEAQSEGCPLETLISVVSKEFTDARLQSHILTVLKGLQSAWQKPTSSAGPPSAMSTSQPDNTLGSIGVVPSELFGILAECEHKKHPGTALLSRAKDLRWPLLAVVASCFTDVTPVSCLTVWLEITAARETSSIKVNDAAAHIAFCVGAAVEATNALPSHLMDFRYNRKNAKRRRLALPEKQEADLGGSMGSAVGPKEHVHGSHGMSKIGTSQSKKSSSEIKQKPHGVLNGSISHDGNEEQESLSKMVAILCEQQRFFPLLKAFELFTPSSSLLPFIRFLQAVSQMRLSEASAHLALFSARLKEESQQIQYTQNRNGKSSTAWITQAAVTAADTMVIACPSAYERRCLLQLLAGADFGDGGAAAVRFRRLYWKTQLAEPALQQGSKPVVGGADLDDDALLLALERQGKWEEARSWARQLELSGNSKAAVHHVTETQAEAMVAEWKEFLWDIPEERTALWNHCQALFKRHTFPPQQAGMFFLKHAEAIEQEIPPSELHVLFLMALQWLSGSVTNTPSAYPLHSLRELETRVWLLAVESEVDMQEAGGQKPTPTNFPMAAQRPSQDITAGGSSFLDPINFTAKSVTIVDNHLKSSRIRNDISTNEREIILQGRQPASQDQNSPGVSGAISKLKRRPRAYGQHKRIHVDRTGKSVVEQEGIQVGASSIKKAEPRGVAVLQEEAKAGETTASEDQIYWEERVGEQELERAVLSLLEVGQVSAARQLQQKLAPTHAPMELLLVEAAQTIAMLSKPLVKGCIGPSMMHPSVIDYLLSSNVVSDISSATPLEVLEAISKACREGCGRGVCRRITAIAEVAKFLELPFSEAFEKQPTQLLQLLSLKAQDALSEARLLIETHSMPAASIAKILAESFLKGLLAAHRGGYMDSSQREEGPAPLLWRPDDFLKWGKLCQYQPELGHALMRLVISGHDVPHACEVELLILAHHFYMQSACLDGIDVLLALAATRVESYISEGDFVSLARLVTGLNNFQALHFMLDILIENGQLELLLQKRAAVDAAMESSASVRGFRMAVLSTLKHFNPHDLDAFAMVYDQFDMKHEMADLLESRARNGLEQWLVQHDPEQSEELLEMMRYHVEAAEVWAGVDAGNKARCNCALASLISLQLRIPDRMWLNLTETNARRLLVEQSRFQEALTVAEAYGLNQPGEWVPVLWNQMLRPGWIDLFLGEFVATLPLPPSMLMELARFYRAEVTARGDQLDFSTWLAPGGLPLDWARYLGKSFRYLLKYVRDMRLRVQLATLATGFADVLDVCMRILDKVPETAGPVILRKGHGGTYLPLM